MAAGLRPTFECSTDRGSADVSDRLRDAVDRDGLTATWSRVAGASAEVRGDQLHALIRLPEGRRSIWSPWLHLDVQTRDGKTHLFGRFSPNPALWTAYMLGYLLIGSIAFLSLMFGVGQWMSGAAPTAWWTIAFVAVPAAAMWWASQIGQRLADDQMRSLRQAVEAAL
jgi:hypothetical protein